MFRTAPHAKKDAVNGLNANSLVCDVIAGCGRKLDENGKPVDSGKSENALFILTTVRCHAEVDKAIGGTGDLAVAKGIAFDVGF